VPTFPTQFIFKHSISASVPEVSGISWMENFQTNFISLDDKKAQPSGSIKLHRWAEDHDEDDVFIVAL